MSPLFAARTFITIPITSIPCEVLAVLTQVEIGFFTFSPFGAKALEPKSITKAIRFVSLSAFVFRQIDAKFGFTEGGVDGMSSLLKTNDQPSTAPSSISTVGQVIAAVHFVDPGTAW